MSKTKKSRPIFERKEGSGTPVLRFSQSELKLQEGERDKAFFARMSKKGYDSVETTEKHVATDGMAYHAGSADKCHICRRSKAKSGKATPEVEKAEPTPEKIVEEALAEDKDRKPETVEDKESSVVEAEVKKKRGRPPKPLDQKMLDRIDKMEENSEHIISNEDATQFCKTHRASSDAKYIKKKVAEFKKKGD